MITFSDHKEFDPGLLLPLFAQAPWAQGRTAADTRLMLAHTDLIITAWDGPRLVGCGRVLTDYVYRASIWDVIVDVAYQGRDIGTQIIQHILGHPSLHRVELFWLCTRDKQAFYETLGFSAKEQTGMVWNRSKHQSATIPTGLSRPDPERMDDHTQAGGL
ncbi:MAG: N-acetyltransferase [Nitrospirae bacterium]|nr:MAG: N-acetyltransferase [Nitrospirota bacterium]